MVIKKSKKLLIVISLLLLVSMVGSVAYAKSTEVTDYRKMPAPEGVKKPKVGFKFHIESEDGTVTEQWTRGEFSGTLDVKVGDKVTVTDWSSTNTPGAKLKMWDYQKVLPDGQEIVREKSARLDGVIDTFTVSQEGHYEFYIAVSDTGGQELRWDNWSQNGSHTAVKYRGGKEYKWYFVRLDMNAESDEAPPPVPVISKEDGTVMPNGATIHAQKGETLNLYGHKSWFPKKAKFRYFCWQYKKESSSTWITILEGENEDHVQIQFNELGRYNVQLGVTDEFEQVK